MQQHEANFTAAQAVIKRKVGALASHQWHAHSKGLGSHRCFSVPQDEELEQLRSQVVPRIHAELAEQARRTKDLHTRVRTFSTTTQRRSVVTHTTRAARHCQQLQVAVQDIRQLRGQLTDTEEQLSRSQAFAVQMMTELDVGSFISCPLSCTTNSTLTQPTTHTNTRRPSAAIATRLQACHRRWMAVARRAEGLPMAPLVAQRASATPKSVPRRPAAAQAAPRTATQAAERRE